MYYTKEYLSAEKGRLGNYKGYDVYTCKKAEYNRESKQWYIIWDDGNKLVREGKCYGKVDVNGQVDNVPPYNYKVEKKKASAPVEKSVEIKVDVPQDINTEEFFKQLAKEIDEVLKGAAM